MLVGGAEKVCSLFPCFNLAKSLFIIGSNYSAELSFSKPNDQPPSVSGVCHVHPLLKSPTHDINQTYGQTLIHSHRPFPLSMERTEIIERKKMTYFFYGPRFMRHRRERIRGSERRCKFPLEQQQKNARDSMYNLVSTLQNYIYGNHWGKNHKEDIGKYFKKWPRHH